MAEIYLAKQDSFGGFTRTVVVKRMLPQLAVRPDFVQMFLDEARLAANLNHPNIVSVFNLGEVDQSYFIAMEFVDGPHLGSLFAQSLRKRKPLPIELCAYVVARAADGLHYAHEQSDPATGSPLNLVHRDISPQNILVSRQGDVKVTDFGVAKASTQQTKTRTGIIKGKVAYMSPEQCLGEIVDRRTDVFALGIVLYELLTRRRLFRDKSDLLIMQKITGEDVKPPSAVNRDLDAELDAICLRALARARDERFSSASELAEAIDAWLASKAPGDPRAHMQRWFEQNAGDLAVGSEVDPSRPSIATERHVRPTSPGEATAATPSLNSAETVMRTSTGSRDAVSSPEITNRERPPPRAERDKRGSDVVDAAGRDVRPQMRAEEALPTRGDAPEEPTQRSPAPEPPRAEPSGEEELDGMTARLPASSGAALPSHSPPRRFPIAAAAGVAGLLVVVTVAAVLLHDSGGAAEGVADAEIDAGAAADDGADADPAAAAGAATGDATADAAPTPAAAAAADAGANDRSHAAGDAAHDDKPTPAAAPKPAKLVIDSEPGVEILLDGRSVGVAPGTLEHAPGHVKVQALFQDQPPITEELEVAAGEVRDVHVRAKVPLVVKVTPNGARVIVENDERGATPFERRGMLAPGKAVKIRVEAHRCTTLERVVKPVAGTPVVIEGQLTCGHAPVSSQPSRPGTLKMRSNPWVNVKVGATGVTFSTPKAIQVPSGRQVLYLDNPEEHIHDQVVVTIPEAKELRVDLVYKQQKNGSWKLTQRVVR